MLQSNGISQNVQLIVRSEDKMSMAVLHFYVDHKKIMCIDE